MTFEDANLVKSEHLSIARHYHEEAEELESQIQLPMSEESFLGYCFIQDTSMHRCWIHLLEWAAHGDLE